MEGNLMRRETHFVGSCDFQFNSEKVLFLLYPNRSGVPKAAMFSTLVQDISGVTF